MCNDIADLGDNEEDEFPNPIILDSDSSKLVDTWGEARSSGNTHEGTDIFAPTGAYIVMPVDGVVDRTGESSLGGKHVFVYIAGGEKLYFAHLDDWADGLDDGDEVKKGDLIGYVGNTGATWANPHLHLAIYKNNQADNPFPRMEDQDWTLKEKITVIDNILDDLSSTKAKAEAKRLLATYPKLFKEAQDKKVALPTEIEDIIDEPADNDEDAEDEDSEPVEEGDLDAAADFEVFEEDLKSGDDSDEVERLQEFLNDVEDEDLDENGEFDSATLAAVKRFQIKYKKQVLDIWGLDTATGFVGPTTRLRMNFMIQSEGASCPVFTQYNSRTQNTNSDEVKLTEELLKELGLFSGTPDKVWNTDTHNAMIKFQEKFSATMLKPWGLSAGTGYKYKTTNLFMNYLRGCATKAVELDGKGSFGI